ncbi:MAG: hypothetical protein SPI77_01535 [Corynebacterium sp.]|nr:hypothetical protein [Corynebacterium sp.]
MTNPPAYPQFPGNDPQPTPDPYAAFPAPADHPGSYMDPEDAPTATDGKLRPLEAIAFGFKRPAQNFFPWFAYVIIMLVVSIVLSTSGTLTPTTAADPTSSVSVGFSVVNGLVNLILSIVGIVAGIRCVDRRRVPLKQFFSTISWLPMVGMVILQGLVTGTIIAIVAAVSPGIRQFATAAMDNSDLFLGTADPTDPAVADEMVAEMANLPWGALIGSVALILVVSLVLSPLVSYWSYFLADGRGSFGQAISEGFRAGARNIGQIIILDILVGLAVTVGILITFGIGMIYLIPVAYLAQAHAYRQIAGGPVPVGSVPPQV